MFLQGFCGPSNPTQSVLADTEQTVNFYQERVESRTSPFDQALYPTPGFRDWCMTTDVGGRRGIYANGRAFMVMGGGLWETFADKSCIKRGTVVQDSNPATLSYNGLTGGQLFITSGTHGYCFTLATNTLTQVLTGIATMGGVVNTRFLAFDRLTGLVHMSALNDGTTWNLANFFARGIGADPTEAMVIRGPDVILIGSQTGEVWQDVGASPQPFAAYPGATFGYGTVGPFAVSVTDDLVVWLAQTSQGAGRMVSMRGYVPQPISNYAVETALSSYQRKFTITDCEVLTYEQEGHLFGVFSFPSARNTWVVDLDSVDWHERRTWDVVHAREDAWRPRCHLYAFGKHLTAERATGMISEMDVTFGLEAGGGPIRRLRTGPPLFSKSRERLVISQFELMADPGLGLISGQGSDPLVMFRWSKNGKTWSNERLCSAGKMGQYGKRIFWGRCGSSTGLWIPQIAVSDPIPLRIAGAKVEGTGFEMARAA